MVLVKYSQKGYDVAEFQLCKHSLKIIRQEDWQYVHSSPKEVHIDSPQF